MKIAVTGGNGHVGINLCAKLCEQGHDVRALVHKNSRSLQNLNLTLFNGDVLDRDSLIPFIKDAEVVFHLAAKISITGEQQDEIRAINAEGTRNMVDLSRASGVRRFIHFSSIHAFCSDPVDELLDETRSLVTDEGYAYNRSKADGERIVMKAAAEGFDAFVLSPTSIIGPMDFEPSLMGKAFQQLYRGQIPALVPGGYNWVDVRDVVDAAVASIEKGKKGEKYLLAGHWLSLAEVAALIQKHSQKKIVSTVIPFWCAWIGLPFITLYSRLTGREPLYTRESLEILSSANKEVSHQKASTELGFSPRSMDETVRDTMVWFRQNGFLDESHPNK